MNYEEIKNHSCGTCKYFKQGETCCYCSHPKATDNEKGYRYYNFQCEKEYKYESNRI
jgi:hypothetical protein